MIRVIDDEYAEKANLHHSGLAVRIMIACCASDDWVVRCYSLLLGVPGLEPVDIIMDA